MMVAQEFFSLVNFFRAMISHVVVNQHWYLTIGGRVVRIEYRHSWSNKFLLLCQFLANLNVQDIHVSNFVV